MKVSGFFTCVVTLLVIGCDNSIEVDRGPCKFAPPESKFAVLSEECEECYFTLQFRGKEYLFAGNQIETIPSGIGWSTPDKTNLIRLTRNAFLSFYFVSPMTMHSLLDGRDVKTPFLKVDSLAKLGSHAPPAVSASFGIYDYCRTFFEPGGSVQDSFHKLTDAEVIETGVSMIGNDETDLHPYQVSILHCSGELQATLDINGVPEVVTAQYKVKAELWERL